MRPAIPYDPPCEGWAERQDQAYRQRCRELAEAGKIRGRGKLLPLYRMKPEPPEDVA